VTSSTRPEPALQDLVSVFRAPSVLLSAPSGQLEAGGVQGLYRNDLRLLSRFEVDVSGVAPLAVGHRSHGANRAVFHAVLPGLGNGEPAEGPTLRLERTRVLTDDGLTERLELANFGDEAVSVQLRLTAASDLAGVGVVRAGDPTTPVPPEPHPARVRWAGEGVRAVLDADPAPAETTVDGGAAVLGWHLVIQAGQRWCLTATVTGTEQRAAGFQPRRPAWPVPLTPPGGAVDPRCDRMLRRGLDDLDGLLLADPERAGAAFLAAGSPWYFTLFGRDSLWAARLLLPLSVDLAEGTLWSLATRQGRREDPVTEEQPGKIPHEVRRSDFEWVGAISLPPLYYGTIDATALWVCLLHEAWRAGLPDDRVEPLLPFLAAALEWIGSAGDADGDGFLEYTGSTTTGLVNQGWKDSPGAVRWADGRVAKPPLALCEVQGYAYRAACGGAELLDAFGMPGGPRWREWAAALRERFRSRFWVADDLGRYPAIALDGDKNPVDAATSNMGHLLGTGLLDADEAGAVAARLAQPDLNTGYGLRTLSARGGGYNPVSYHRGSIWPHDTAITMLGLLAEGHAEQARSLAGQLLDAAERFDYRLPELYCGTDTRRGEPVSAYPSACTPQAWASAAGVVAVGVLAGWPHPVAARTPNR
jgi:hypothetical protein